MDLIERVACVVSGEQDLEYLHSFPKFPVFMGCVEEGPETDVVAEMVWKISRSSGVIQLGRLVPLDVLYPKSHGAGEVGGLWRTHHQEFARFLHHVKPTGVFEIGGAHGILAHEYMEAYGLLPWTILEPNPHPIPGTRANFVRGFFDSSTRHVDAFDVVVHSHVFEHVYDPAGFMSDLSNFLPPGSSLVFSVPNMAEMLRRKYTNCINFEHTVLLTDVVIDHFLSTNGFEVRRKEFFRDDHSIFYDVVRADVASTTTPLDLYSVNRRLYMEYISYHLELVSRLNQTITSLDSPVYVFGAHVFTQYLIAFGLDLGKVAGALDNDVQKQGKRLYGTPLMVFSPDTLRNQNEPYVILKAGVYNREIQDDILTNINPLTRFLE